jgi:membrane-associated protease RseP (regulator of RpoE activity)
MRQPHCGNQRPSTVSPTACPIPYRRGSRLPVAALACCCFCWSVGSPAKAAPDEPPPAAPSSTGGQAPASGFQSRDISIGEPISLPFAAPLPPAQPPASPPAFPRTALAAAESVAAAAPEAAGHGWLGLSVDDTVVTGRLVVVEVAPEGPAARSGVRPQDVLLAINGSQLKDSDELAAALAAIAPGQRVRMALGRDNRIEEVEALATARPSRASSREQQAAAAPAAITTVPAPAPSEGVPGASNFTASPAAPTTVAVPQALPPLQPAAVSMPQAEPQTVGVAPSAPRTESLAPMMAAPSQFQSAAPGRPPLPSASAPVAPAVPAALDAAPAFAAAPPISAPAATAALAPAPASAAAVAPPASIVPATGRTALGVRTVPVDAATRARFQLHEQHGAMVIGVVHDLPAARAGVPPGSVIVAINHQPVRSPQDLTQLVTQGPVGQPVPLEYVLPGGESRKADVVLQSLDRPLEQALVGSEARPIAPGGEPPTLAPAPSISRRVQPTVANHATETAPLGRLEEMLQRINDRLDRLEQRFERLPGGR